MKAMLLTRALGRRVDRAESVQSMSTGVPSLPSARIRTALTESTCCLIHVTILSLWILFCLIPQVTPTSDADPGVSMIRTLGSGYAFSLHKKYCIKNTGAY